MLEELICPLIEDVLDNHHDEFGDHIYYQQDGAPPHFTQSVKDFLNETFPERWIGRGGPMPWPPRSPDLTPLDFYMWGFIKDRVYRTEVKDLAELKKRISDCCKTVTPDMLAMVRNEMDSRIHICQEVNGGTFEQLL